MCLENVKWLDDLGARSKERGRVIDGELTTVESDY
jgi:hypothetical protein